jgi:hypothetical protein
MRTIALDAVEEHDLATDDAAGVVRREAILGRREIDR